MKMIDHEVKGRAVAQYFISELEKIAYSSRVRSLYRAAQAAEDQVGDAASALGVRRYIPFTQAHRAYYGHVGVPGSGVKGRAAELASQAEAAATKERSALLTALETGKGNQADIIRRLNQGPQQVGRVRTPLRQAARSAGVGGQLERPQFESAPRSSLARGALAYGAPALAGAGALYAGQQYLNQQQQGYGGY
jgi:hypothetical protein